VKVEASTSFSLRWPFSAPVVGAPPLPAFPVPALEVAVVAPQPFDAVARAIARLVLFARQPGDVARAHAAPFARFAARRSRFSIALRMRARASGLSI